MHIVIITGPFQPVPPAPGGAVERMWQELAEEFSVKGHQVTFLCRAHHEQKSDETVRGVHYVRRMFCRRSKNLLWDLFRDLLYSIRMLAHIPNADIIVTNTFWLPILLTSPRRKSGKIIVNVNRMPKGQMRWYRNVDRLIAVSNAISGQITVECPAASPLVKVIPNPIDTKIFVPPNSPRCFQKIQTILYAGRVHPEKGIHLLIEAFCQLYVTAPDIRLRIMGPVEVYQGGGGAEYLEKLKALADGHPIEFCPPTFVKHELAKAYQEAHLFCYPSLAETGESFGLAPLEAMATGLAPVVSNLACFKDFITAGTTGLVFDHRAPDAAIRLSVAFKECIADPPKTMRLGRNAAQLALHFSKERVAEQYLKDFEGLLANRV